MGYFDQLVNLGNGQRRGASTAYAAQYPLYEQQTPQYPYPQPYTLAAQGYRTNEVVYAAIGARMDAIKEPPLWVYDDSGETPEEIRDDPIRKLLRRPNERVTEKQFWMITQMYLDIAGFAAWEKERNRVGEVIHLWPMRPDWCSFYRGDGRPLRAVRYQPYGLPPADISIDDIVLFQYFDPLYPLLKGFSPTMSVLREIGVDNSMTDFLADFMKHGAQFSGLLKTAQTLQDSEAENIRRRWMGQHGGVGNWSAPAVIGNGVEYQNTGMTMRDMVFPDLDGRTEARICMTFRISPILIGAKVGLNASTYSNYEQARGAWYEGWVSSQWEFLAEQAGEQLIPEFHSGEEQDNFYCAFMTQNVKALQENKEKVWTRAIDAAKTNILTRDEAREEIGKDPIDDTDVFVGANAPAVGEETLTAEEKTPPQPKPGEQQHPPAQQPEQAGSEAEQQLEEKQFRAFAAKRVKEGKPEAIAAFQWRYTPEVKRAALLAEYNHAEAEPEISAVEVMAELKRANELLERALKYDPNEPRDKDGKWTNEGGGNGSSDFEGLLGNDAESLGWNYHQKHPEVSLDDAIDKAEAHLRANPRMSSPADKPQAKPANMPKQGKEKKEIPGVSHAKPEADKLADIVSDDLAGKIARSLPKYDYDYVGIRVQETDYDQKIGDEISHESNVWDDGEDTGQSIGGLSAIDVDEARRHKENGLSSGGYPGGVVLILGSDYAEIGEDPGEIVMRKPKILDIMYVSKNK